MRKGLRRSEQGDLQPARIKWIPQWFFHSEERREAAIGERFTALFKPSSKASIASRAPHRSLFEGKWRKMSKKWERNGGREGGRGERWRESFAQERRELSDMGEHIFHVSRHRKCLRVLAPFPFATRLGGREITGNVQARGGKRSLI